MKKKTIPHGNFTFQEARDLLARIRIFMEATWPLGHSTAECEETSRLVCKIFGHQAKLNCGTDWRRLPNGRGAQRFDAGYVDQGGKCHAHYWTDLTIDDQIYIADLTADQFSGPKVVLVKAPHFRYRPNIPQVKDMMSTSRRVVDEVNTWYKAWLDHCINQ